MIILQEGIYFAWLLLVIGKCLAFVVLPALFIIFFFIYRNKQKQKAPQLLVRDYIVIILKAVLVSLLIVMVVSLLIWGLFAISIKTID